MISIVRAEQKHIGLLSEMASTTFIQSHGSSADAAAIENYVADKYSITAFETELSHPENVYHIIYYDGKPAGYSKIIMDFPFDGNVTKSITKLDRLYLLQEFYDLKLGSALFRFNMDLAKEYAQQGMWLYVWKGNQRAVDFYIKAGFKIIGSHDFRISENHSNPNHRMFLDFRK